MKEFLGLMMSVAVVYLCTIGFTLWFFPEWNPIIVGFIVATAMLILAVKYFIK